MKKPACKAGLFGYLNLAMPILVWVVAASRVMLVVALASPNFLGNGLSVVLAFVRQQELDPPVEALSP